MIAEMSNILAGKGDRIWHKTATDGYPPENKPVVIRIVDYNQPMLEHEGKMLYLEDIKVARLVGSGDNRKWFVEGPHPAFDYSSLSHNAVVNPEASVSHWSPLKDGELEAWHKRLSVRGSFEYLKVDSDEKHRETVYRSLSHAALVLYHTSQSCTDPKELQELTIMINTLYDMQACIDQGGEYHRETESSSQEAPEGNTTRK